MTTNIPEITGDRGRAVRLDIIIPVYNEEAVLNVLFEALASVFPGERVGAIGGETVNYILVGDGSTDRTAEMIYERMCGGAPATLIRLSRNFGHQAAVCAGLAESCGDVTAIMDGDL
jgi:polyisoprenyl-phosphate glycosyltransferase